MILYLGTEEVCMVNLPKGFHHMAAVHGIDLQKVALDAVIDRVRAASLADHMSKSIQMKFGQSNLTCFKAD